MKNEWIVIEIGVKGQFVDLVGAVLAENGCQGSVVDEQQLDTFVVPDEELDPERFYTLKAFFSAADDFPELLSRLRDGFNRFPALAATAITLMGGDTVRTEDWAEGWKQNFSLFRIGETLVIRPSWEEYTPQPGEVVIEIDPGMAFGTGTHGTTQLCLEMVAELLQQSDPPRRMLDVGTGSGILALGAAALGCPEIVATDIDEVACRVATENIAKNGYRDAIRVTAEKLETLPGKYDLIVANIMAEENIRLKGAFIDHLETGGFLILSGILEEKRALVCDHFAVSPLRLLDSRQQDEWVSLMFCRG